MPDESTLVGKTIETNYLDEDGEIVGVFYKIAAYDFSGNSTISEAAEIGVGVSETPYEFYVNAPYPNPFNPAMTIEYVIPQESNVSLVIYDILGREVAVLQDGLLGAGAYQAMWDGRDKNGVMVGSGVYLYQFKGDEFIKQGKVMFLR